LGHMVRNARQDEASKAGHAARWNANVLASIWGFMHVSP
jgi:hypothetical protein